MNRRSILTLSLALFLSGCSFLGGDKDTKKLVADGLTPKELYEQAEDKVDSGMIEQAIDQYEMIFDEKVIPVPVQANWIVYVQFL